jgi:acetyltransferase-like isoleucine patch superfamily enzyme
MGHVAARLETAVDLSRLALGRLRAVILRFRGARIGAKTHLGARVRVDKPWAVDIGARCQLEADVWVKVVAGSARLVIGDHVFLGRGVELDVRESLTIGSHVLLAPGVFVTDHHHRIGPDRYIDAQGVDSRPVVIEDDVWLGARSVVLPGVRIGRGAVVGAAAVVTRDVEAGAVVAGVPARVLRTRAGGSGSREDGE